VDIASELGEAGGRDEADVSGADDANGFTLCHMKRSRLAERYRMRPTDRARASICLLPSEDDSVFETQ
jgi:hypothetical protein